MAKKDTKKKEDKTVNKEDWINELDFGNLYTIKHYPKTVFCLCTKPNKAGMVLMEEFLTSKRKYYKTKDVMSLSRLAFYKESGSMLDIKDVFKNIEKNLDEILAQDESSKAMNLIVPGYDKTKFKESHCQKTCDWFGIIKGRYESYTKMNKAIQEKAKELEETE